MSPTRHDTYVQRRKQERERNSARRNARKMKRTERAAFTR